MQLSEFRDRLNDRLNHADYAGVDASANGLQVGRADGRTVERAAFAVDGVEATAETAADAGADVLVVHHGMVWGGLDRVTGRDYDRVAALVDNDLALYVSHLPLDGHAELGNAEPYATERTYPGMVHRYSEIDLYGSGFDDSSYRELAVERLATEITNHQALIQNEST
mgnify:CR=1 FL=1